MIDRLNAALSERYRLLEQIGEGGMATVFLAEDLRHERKVALKVLKPELAAVVGGERFLAEIKTTANLQHPHILPLYDSGEADSFLFYVMPFVEGATLDDRLEAEKQLPVDEAIRIATAVASALDFAHREGVVHRDIKPANILFQDGQPVVSDFGIALAVGAGSGARLTETGLSLGTPYYMSPEQATGEAHVGPSTDIYALGCVLYEMLIGDPPHVGSTAQAVLGKIILGEVDRVTAHRRAVPTNVEAAVHKAVEKVPADRFRTAGQFAAALSDSAFRWGDAGVAGTAGEGGPWKARALGLGTVALLALLSLGWSLLTTEAEQAVPVVTRFTVPVGEEAALHLGGVGDAVFGRPAHPSIAVAPDGQSLVYAAWEVGPDGDLTSQLYERPLGEERAVAIPGTEDAASPVFSPDGEWIGFVSRDALKRVSIASGRVETITPEVLPDGDDLTGISWGDSGTLYYTSFGALFKVSAEGGEGVLVARADTLASGVRRMARPLALPGGRFVLFHGFPTRDPSKAEVLALDLETGARTVIQSDAMDPRYVEVGGEEYLLFLRQGALWGARLDPVRAELLGEPRTLLEDVAQAIFMPNTGWQTGAGQVAISRSGHLVYARGGVYPETPGQLVVVARDGTTTPVEGAATRRYVNLRPSPDGSRLAFAAGPGSAMRLVILELASGIAMPLETGAFTNQTPAWSPSGDTLAFTASLEDGIDNVYTMPVDGSAAPQRLAPSSRSQAAMDWSSQGTIAFLEAGDIWIFRPGGDASPFFVSEETEEFARFSPDGRWIAYSSDRGDGEQVWVRPFSGPLPITRVSTDGGSAPVWARDGRTLFYLNALGSSPRILMSVEVDGTGTEFGAGPPTAAITPWPYVTTIPMANHGTLPDGSFVVEELPALPGETSRATLRRINAIDRFHVILNWSVELQQRMGGG